MSKQLLIGGIIGAVAVTAVGTMAGTGLIDLEENAEVIKVEPMIRTVEVPREVCNDEVITTRKAVKDEHQVTGTVIGAVIGGVLGNQVGGGSGKDIATAGGAIAGGYAGNKVHEKIQDGNTQQSVQQVCSTVYDSKTEQDGYQVTYRLDGEEREIHMDYDPGSSIDVEDGELVIES